MEQIEENILVKADNCFLETQFSWLMSQSSNSLPKVELHWIEGDLQEHKYKVDVLELLQSILPTTYVGGPGIHYPWWMFADEGSDIEQERQFYIMMKAAGITDDYEGYASVTNWTIFLDRLIAVLLNVGGTEPLFMYDVKNTLMFYLHYRGIGFVYNYDKPYVLSKICTDAARAGYKVIETKFLG